MCGIAGIATWRNDSRLAGEIARMTAPLIHRGPDDEGLWIGTLRTTFTF